MHGSTPGSAFLFYLIRGLRSAVSAATVGMKNIRIIPLTSHSIVQDSIQRVVSIHAAFCHHFRKLIGTWNISACEIHFFDNTLAQSNKKFLFNLRGTV